MCSSPPELLQVIDALGPGPGLATFWTAGSSKPTRNANDGDYDQQFDQREGSTPPGMAKSHGE